MEIYMRDRASSSIYWSISPCTCYESALSLDYISSSASGSNCWLREPWQTLMSSVMSFLLNIKKWTNWFDIFGYQIHSLNPIKHSSGFILPEKRPRINNFQSNKDSSFGYYQPILNLGVILGNFDDFSYRLHQLWVKLLHFFSFLDICRITKPNIQKQLGILVKE